MNVSCNPCILLAQWIVQYIRECASRSWSPGFARRVWIGHVTLGTEEGLCSLATAKPDSMCGSARVGHFWRTWNVLTIHDTEGQLQFTEDTFRIASRGHESEIQPSCTFVGYFWNSLEWKFKRWYNWNC